MSLASFNFTYDTDKNGNDGWLLKPEFDVAGNMTIAHDTVEHFRDDDGSVEHELMAMGAVMFGRITMGLATDDGMAIDLTYMYIYANDGSGIVEPCNYKRKINDEYFSPDTLDKICETATKKIIDELDYHNEDNSEVVEHIKSFLQLAKQWIAKGYYRAKRRFKYPDIMTTIFNEIARKAKNINGDFGDVLKVTYQINPDIKVWVTKHYIADDGLVAY